MCTTDKDIYSVASCARWSSAAVVIISLVKGNFALFESSY